MSGKNFFSLGKKKKMFPARNMPDYTLSDDESTMGTLERIEYPMKSDTDSQKVALANLRKREQPTNQ